MFKHYILLISFLIAITFGMQSVSLNQNGDLVITDAAQPATKDTMAITNVQDTNAAPAPVAPSTSPSPVAVAQPVAPAPVPVQQQPAPAPVASSPSLSSFDFSGIFQFINQIVSAVLPSILNFIVNNFASIWKFIQDNVFPYIVPFINRLIGN